MSKDPAQQIADMLAEQLSRRGLGGGLGTYLLDENHQPYRVPMLVWARWFEDADNRVALTETELHEVSTVFLGLDHNWHPDGPPVLFETMVFSRERGGEGKCLGDALDSIMDRYATWDEALKGHNDILREVSKLERKATEKLKSLHSTERNKA